MIVVCSSFGRRLDVATNQAVKLNLISDVPNEFGQERGRNGDQDGEPKDCRAEVGEHLAVVGVVAAARGPMEEAVDVEAERKGCHGGERG